MSKKKQYTQEVKPQIAQQKKVNPSATLEAKIFDKIDYIVIAIALILTFACFSSVKNHRFVNWDDDRNFYENPLITSINKDNFWDNTKQIFQTPVIGNYNPLTHFSFAIDKRIFGLDNPGPWHTENLLLHLVCTFLVYAITRRLGLLWQGAFLVALLFGIHPMRVESVSWVTERKDVLFGLFYLAALLTYIKNRTKPSTLKSVLLYIFFTLSLFAKIQAVSLPLSMIAVDYWFDKKIDLKTIISKWPFFMMSLFFGLLGIYFLKSEGSLDNKATYPFWQRIFVGTYSLVVYFVKVIFPYRLSPLYPYPATIPGSFYPTIIAVPIVLWGMYKAHISQKIVWVFGIGFFLFNIVFLLQVLGAGQGFLADRFTYIAYFGLFFIAGYYFQSLFLKENTSKIAWAIPALVTVAFGFMTFQQNKIWQDSGTLWTHVLKYYDQVTLPFGNRANFYRDKKMFKEAIQDYNSAIALKPEPQTFNSRARLYFDVTKTCRYLDACFK